MSRRCLPPAERALVHHGGYCHVKIQPGKGLAPWINHDACHRSLASLSCAFHGKSAVVALVPGPLAGNILNRGPGTRAHPPAGLPSGPPETCACTRYVIRWSHLSYLSRGPHTTYYLSSCLVTPASNVTPFPGGPCD